MQTQTPNEPFWSSLGLKYEAAFSHSEGLLSFLTEVVPQLPPNSRVLDIGCGTGRPVSASLAAAGHRVTGIDLSGHMVELSRKAVPGGDFHAVDMREYAPPEGLRFGGVFSCLSLFALTREETEAMAAKWRAWMEPGGMLCVVTMAAEDLDTGSHGGKYDADELCVRGINGQFMGNDIQSTLFTREGWGKLLADSGFTIKKTKMVRHVPPPDAGTGAEDHYFIVAEKTS